MFWKVFEFIIRIIYFRRFRAAARIGAAGQMLTQGKPHVALELLEKAGHSLHQSLLPLYAFTRGKILNALSRREEAEASFKLVALTDPRNPRADLELAMAAGRRGDLEECEQWLDRAQAKESEETGEVTRDLRSLLEKTRNGERRAEIEARAIAMSTIPVGTAAVPLGLPPDLAILREWIGEDPSGMRERFDEVALLLGQGEVAAGGQWVMRLSLEDCHVARRDGSVFHPFETLDAMFS